jgi:hypothetical protein
VPHGEAAWFDSWLVTHAVGDLAVLDGDGDGPVAEQLRASAIGAWWARDAAWPVAATPWDREEAVRLHARHEPFGTLQDGALVVGRAVEVAPGHLAMIGRPIVVDGDAVSDVLGVLHRAPEQALFAALRWPEHRTHTAEGALVQHCIRWHAVEDPEGVIGLLREADRAQEHPDVMTSFEDDVEFRVVGAGRTQVVTPAAEPGVVWELCDEDLADPQTLGDVTVSVEECEVALSAPTSERVERLFAALPAAVQASLGAISHEDLDLPEVLPRMRRERLALLTG